MPMTIALRVLLPVLSIGAIGALAPAQEAPALSIDVKVVTLLATVHDHDGKVVKGLTAKDFVLKEDGAPQKIRYFSQEPDLPLTVGVLVDTSRSQEGVLEEERLASKLFLNQVLRPGKDRAFVVQFDTQVQTLAGLTPSREELSAALDRLRVPDRIATLLNSAVKESSENILRQQPGRKALILLTDGVAFRDPTSIQDAIEFAQRADAIIYSIRFSDPVGFRGPIRSAVMAAAKEHGKQGLERMARETGGVAYEVNKGQSIEGIYAQIEDALRNQYSIGYTPPRQADDGKFHRIKLTTTDRSLVVQTRDGYYAK